MHSEKVTFPGHSGEALSARLDLPSGSPQATAIFAHCFSCSKDIAAARRISQRLTASGFAVLRFDFTGLGHSQGEFANTSFSTNVADLHAANAYLTASQRAPSLMIGHSLGGAAVLRAAPDMESVKAVVTIGAPFDPAHVIENFGSSLDEIMTNGAAEVSLAGRAFTIRKSFVEDIRAASLMPAISQSGKALLVLHSPIDQTVGIDNAGRIFAAARHPKSFVTLDNADHLISRAEDAEYAADIIAAWAGRYVGRSSKGASEGAPEGVVRSSEASPAAFLQDISAGPSHHTLADEPITHGGTDLGMTPYNLLSAGLASCTSMTLRMYARRKGFALHHVSVDVIHDKIHATDCAECETDTGRIDRFERRITLTGDLSGPERAQLLEIADRCPVHRTLEAEVQIVTRLNDEPN